MWTPQSKTYDSLISKLITCTVKSVKWPLSKRPKIGFQDQLFLNVGQKYCRMLPTFIKPPFALRSLFCLFLNGRFTQVLL